MSPAWDLTDDDLLAMPLDELALRVLADYRDTRGWNWRNWLLGHKQGPAADAVLAEAWGWIVNHGLVARSVDQSTETVNLSRAGHSALAQGLPWLRATQRLDVELTSVLAAKARPLFLRGDLETAAFVAMKEVEVAIRTASGLPAGLVGVKLAREAFKEGGPLRDPDDEPGEAVATMDLFAGALGAFKNPTSHRHVVYDDPTEAAEIILLADLLLRMLARRTGTA